MAERPIRWLEISADYRCNNRCIGCFSVLDDGGPSMSPREVAASLVAARRRGATCLWLGGGEPTLRRDLLATVRRARELGYERVKLQTNGMLLAYPDFTERLVEAGITEVNFAIKGARAETHDRLTRTPRCHELMLEGMAQARHHDLPLEGDILVYRSNMAELPEMVQLYTQQGLTHFNVWLFSATDQGDRDLSQQVPRIADVMPFITRAMDLGLGNAPDFISSLHTPPCTLPPSHRRAAFHAAELELWVQNPGGYGFFLEESPIEGGHYLEGCARCSLRAGCGGIRQDYVAIHGDSEFVPES